MTLDEEMTGCYDVWEENGKVKKSMIRDGCVVLLYYLYNFGVSSVILQWFFRTIGITKLNLYPLV